jgi:hypothetical protein
MEGHAEKIAADGQMRRQRQGDRDGQSVRSASAAWHGVFADGGRAGNGEIRDHIEMPLDGVRGASLFLSSVQR